MGTLLRYPYEVRSEEEYFDEIQDVKVTKDMLDLARHIVEQKAGRFEPDKFEDQYETALVDLINQKRAGKPITPKERPRGENVVDLMDALRKSVGGAATESKAAGKPAKKSKKASAGQKEMLMPIAGKKPAKETAAKKPAARSQRKSAQPAVQQPVTPDGRHATEDFDLAKAAIFDLDGTLLDSVDLHAIAWHEAMMKFRHDVSFEQARGQIGKGGDKLIPVFLSADEQRDHGKELEEWRGDRFKTKYLPLVRPFSAVPDLLRRVRDAGLRIAIASSAKKDELDKYLDIARITDLVEKARSKFDAIHDRR